MNPSERHSSSDIDAQIYNDGRLYRPATGRSAPRQAIVDYAAQSHLVVTGKPLPEEFLRLIERELKIRFYTSDTIKSYLGAARRFLSWFGRLPHQVTREDVREYPEVLVDGGASSSHVGTTLSGIPAVFDKMCCRRTTQRWG